MDTIKKYKKVFIIIIITAALLSLLLTLPIVVFSTMTTKKYIVSEEKNLNSNYYQEENSIDENNHLIFNDGVASCNYEGEFISKTTENNHIFSAYLEEGDVIEISYNLMKKNGSLDFNLMQDSNVHSSFDSVYNENSIVVLDIDESGDYSLDCTAKDFKGKVTMDILIKRNK